MPRNARLQKRAERRAKAAQENAEKEAAALAPELTADAAASASDNTNLTDAGKKGDGDSAAAGLGAAATGTTKKLPPSTLRKPGAARAESLSLAPNVHSLRVSDLQLLKGPHWLNDALVNFYFSYLDQVKFKANDDFLFITPEMAECILYMDDTEMQMLLVDQLNALRKPFVFFALTDTKCKLNGAHWVLLVVSRPEKTFFHFDSYGGNHSNASSELMNHVKDVLDMRQARFRTMRCLQQMHGYDCGIHVMCMADQIADYVNRFESVDGLPLLQQDVVKAKRTDLLKLITSMGGRT